jgi:competence protein ComEA
MTDEKPEKSQFTELLSFDGLLANNSGVIVAVLLCGLILIGLGVFMYRQNKLYGDRVEILNVGDNSDKVGEDVVVEIAGAVQKPGVYKLAQGDRIEDLLIAAGGLSLDADREWFERSVNRASKLTDGQKVYIFRAGELDDKNWQSSSKSAEKTYYIEMYQSKNGAGVSKLVNINTSSLSELDSLPGIGQVYGQRIIEHRPYSSIEELVTKGVLKESLFQKIKNSITAY